jgi:FtsP/CotA-like multicopper oxidase with cupredoxin domain
MMKRREFLAAGTLNVLAVGAGALWPKHARADVKADLTLTIEPVTVDLTPTLTFSTIGYNGSSPGPVLRMREGVPHTIDVVNETDVPEQVHWHGLLLPSELDGSEEEGALPVPPHGSRRYQITPRPAGTRWYHTHTMAMGDLHRGSYTGQFGFLIVDGRSDPGHYDQEVFLALRDWEPFFTSQMSDAEAQNPIGPQPERPQVVDAGMGGGLEVSAAFYSINGKALGAGEPIRVREGQRVLFHVLNASAIENRSLAFPGHQFRVIALDGQPVPSPQLVDQIFLGAGERIDAIVEMNRPGVWILGAPEDRVRNAGLGVIVEYAGQRGRPRWISPGRFFWDYAMFGETVMGMPAAGKTPIDTIEMVFEMVPRAYGKFNGFLVNGKPYPHDREFVLKQGQRYRLVLRNRTNDAHPMHLHRHLFELVEIYGKPTAGIIKDTVVVPAYDRAAVEFVADQPGLTLFHCHIQQHMDYGFKALFRYE